MSIQSITGLAVVRNIRKPTKADAGVTVVGAKGSEEEPTLPQILAKTLPVGLVTAYTAFIGGLSEVTEPTPENPNPNQFLWLRALACAVMVTWAAADTYLSYRRKAASGARPPWLEVAAITTAAAAWGLGVPESPLLAAIEDKQLGVVVLGLVAFIGIAVNSVLSKMLKAPAGTSRTARKPAPAPQS